MKCRRTIQLGLVRAVLFLALGLAPCASAQTRAYELCLEQSPAQAGTLTPDSGTHRFSADTVVVVSAQPLPGYQFAYWLGDVADPKSQRTTVQLNSPKIVVAVFQPANKDVPNETVVGAGGGGGGGGGSGLLATRIDLSMPGGIVTGGGKVKSEVVAVPVPVPEPTTVALLSLGALALYRRRR
jgi:hypothetical protein